MANMWRTLKYWTEKLTEVSNSSFPKTQMPSVMQIETEVPKNKIFKLQVSNMSLTLNVSIYKLLYYLIYFLCFSSITK
jgi:hypothetical protein